MKLYREMTDAGLGAWFGAFYEGCLVGDLGIFTDGEFCRFQMVGTHPEYRRLGICSSLIYAASQFALEKFHAKTLVLVADPEYHALKLYESIGFTATERQARINKNRM